MPMNCGKFLNQRCKKVWINLFLNNWQVMLLINHYECHIALLRLKIRNISIRKKCKKASYMLIMLHIKSIKIELWQIYVRLKNHSRKAI